MNTEKTRVVALGFFDGVHLGHKAVLHRTKERAASLNATPSVLTFDPHPKQFITGKQVPLINSLADRKSLIQRLHGIDDLLVIPFDESFRRMPWADFILYLQEKFHAVHLVCGHDFQFGCQGAGHPEALREKCQELQLGCDVIPEISLDGLPIRSRHIRRLLIAGDMGEANRFLGHPHTLTETVVYGRKLGRILGVPTINMHFPQDVLSPARGVYATRAFLEDGSSHIAVTNIGARPTLGPEGAVTVETHILDFDGDLYGKQARLEFLHFLRPERKFQNISTLGAQIQRDVDEARAYFEESIR